jgi:uncharacterized peroxidase-related enzyme
MIEADAASPEVLETYEVIQREMGIPFVPNIDKALANAPNAARATHDAIRGVFLQTSLPMSLAMMLLFRVASSRSCNYCGSFFKASCMQSGIDADTLAAIEKELETVSPKRVQAIIKFGEKCAFDPQNLHDDDYESVRDQGVTDEELVEIVTLAGLGVYLTILAGALRVEVDDVIAQALSA